MTKKGALAIAAVLAFGTVPACNAFTGVDDLEIGDRGPEGKLYPSLVAMPGLTVTDVALYQAVKVPIMAGGKPVKSDISIIQGRDAMIRVFVQLDPTFSGKPVTGRIFFEGNPTPIETTQTLDASSTDAKLHTTLNFDIPGAMLTEGAKYRVLVGEASGALPRGPAVTGYPAKGYEPIVTTYIGETLKIVIAPVAYGADGSNRVPDMEALLQMYIDGFRSMYPAPKLEITVRAEPIAWKQSIGPGGNGWGELLDHVGQTRQKDGVAPDVYYYAPFAPEDSFGQFCGGGCVAGLGMLGQAGDQNSRSAIGLGYPDADSIVTALHEIGHCHGRNHAPCGGAGGPDPGYPHQNGADGVWGYNISTQKLFAPEVADIMGYCSPVWISDYTFNALAERVKLVNHARVVYPPELLNRLYDRVMINPDGSLKWLDPARLATPPLAEPTPVVVESDGMSETVEAQLYRFDHLDGGIAFWPVTDRPVRAVRLDVAGTTRRLTR